MSCLVTGAAGFIGSHLAESLVDDGLEVIGIDAFIDNYRRGRKQAHLERLRDSAGFRLVEGTLQSLDLESLLTDVDVVFHLAALPGVRPSWGAAFDEYVAHNVVATQRLLEAARAVGTERFVYASSSSVYGDTDVLPMREDAVTSPYSPYGVTKLAGEHLTRLYWRNLGVPAVSLRYFTVYGPRQRPDMAIQRFLVAARDGTPISVFGDGEQGRDFTYVADVVDATRRAAEKGRVGAVYNVGGGSQVTVNELIATIDRVSGRSLEVDREAKRPGDVRFTRADVERAREDLDFIPQCSLEEGLASQWKWLNSEAGRNVTES